MKNIMVSPCGPERGGCFHGQTAEIRAASGSGLWVCEDVPGRVWATFENRQLARIEDGQWVDAGRDDIEATCVAADRDGSIWLGSRAHGLHRISGDP